MKFAAKLAGTVRAVVRTVAEAPRVRRELLAHRAAEAPAAVPAPLLAEDVTGEPPTPAEVEDAARAYEQARTATNAAARTKRAAEKVLKRAADGQHGAVTVERFESSRLVADLDAIKAVFAAHGLGDVPMKRCAPTLTLTWSQETAEDVHQAPAEALAA